MQTTTIENKQATFGHIETPAAIAQPKKNVDLISTRVAQVYAYTAAAFTVTCATAFACMKIGFAATVLSTMLASPGLSTLAFIAIGISLVALTKLTSKENAVLKHAAYGAFAGFQGIFLSPLALFNPGIFAAASAATVVVTTGLGFAAMHIKENFEKYEKILLVALGALVVISLGSLLLPAGAAAISHEISYLGGFALFSMMMIYETHKARTAAAEKDFDPINHSIGIYQDSLNLFIRIYEFFMRNKFSSDDK